MRIVTSGFVADRLRFLSKPLLWAIQANIQSKIQMDFVDFPQTDFVKQIECFY